MDEQRTDFLGDLHFPMVLTIDREFLNLVAYGVVGGILGGILAMTLGPLAALAIIIFTWLLTETPRLI